MKLTSPHRLAASLALAAIAIMAAPSRGQDAAAPMSLESPASAPSPTAEVFDTTPAPLTFSLLTENDSRPYNPFNSSDRHYTNGARAAIVGTPDFTQPIADFIPDFTKTGFDRNRTVMGLVGGQNMYTPRDRYKEGVIENDRPYAGWLYGGVLLQRAGDKVFDHFEIDMGVVGESALAEDTQDYIHDILDEDKFKGWDNQLHDEFAFNFTYQRRWKFGHRDLGKGVAFDIIPHAGFTAGMANLEASGGATFRIGWNLPDDFGPGNIAHPLDYTSRPGAKSVYGFIRANGRAVQHNMFIEGNNYHDSHGVDQENLVGELTFGLAVQFSRRLQFVYSQTYMTREFEDQKSFDSYGTYALNWSIDF